ncbi:MAG TPA: hypothetical protein DEF61_02620 [Firmicutes bacterium]|nr:hypothetical protein [Bacillota bacterium]HBM70405.1 hypothetical protein [Bacillota bacterium]HBX25158.1 hypothetical protein [Bacillota bacterium]
MKVLSCDPYNDYFFVGANRDEFVKEVYPLLMKIRFDFYLDHAAWEFASSYEEIERRHQIAFKFKMNPSEGIDKDKARVSSFLEIASTPLWDIYFIINKTFTKLFVVEPDYPACYLWNGNSPFRKCKQFEFFHLSILNQSSMLAENGLPYVETLCKKEHSDPCLFIKEGKRKSLKEEQIIIDAFFKFQKGIFNYEDYLTVVNSLGYEFTSFYKEMDLVGKLMEPPLGEDYLINEEILKARN